MKLDLRQTAKFVLRFEDVAEHVLEELRRFRLGVEWQFSGLMLIAERPQVVDSKNMVGMRMRVQYGVHSPNAFSYGLFAKVRRGINQHAVSIIFDKNGWAGAPVMLVRRIADRAITTDGRHSHKCAAAEHRQRCLHLPKPGFTPLGLFPATPAGFCGARERALITST